MISQQVNGSISYYGYDGLGSTKFLTNQNGLISDTYQYNAYGEVTSKTGNTDNNYLYAGEQFDRSLNQYYLRARYYNQGVGRFTQMDSWQGRVNSPITLNKYLYANANPTYYTDPSGYVGLGDFSVAQSMMSNLISRGVNFYRAVSKFQNIADTINAVYTGFKVLNNENGSRVPSYWQPNNSDFQNRLSQQNFEEAALVLQNNAGRIAVSVATHKAKVFAQYAKDDRSNIFFICQHLNVQQVKV